MHATLLVLLVLNQSAAEKPGDRLIAGHLAHAAAKLEQTFLPDVSTSGEWERVKPEYRKKYLDMLGLWPTPEKSPLKATVTGTVDFGGIVVEKLHFQSVPGLYVTANLWRPKKVEGRLPAVLYVCGHSNKGRDGNKSAYQHHGAWFANNGYVCLIVDTLQLGEIAGVHHGTYREGRWWWHSAGYTSAGVECWNGVRAIDYLVSRTEVDADRIAVTGISGGGAATFWIAAADERVKVAVPVSGMADLGDYVGKRIVNGHCDCMFLYNTHQWNWTTVAALVAPRPLLFANSDRDTIFPMPANERVRERLERLYGLYGPKTVSENFAVCVVPGGHADRIELRLMAYRWINRHLKGNNGDVFEPPLERLDGAKLRVFPTDADLPKDALNARIDETFVPVAKVAVPAPGHFTDWQHELRNRLRDRCFDAWPDKPHFKPLFTLKTERFHYRTMETEPGIAVESAVPQDRPAGKREWIVVLGTEDSGVALPEWARKAVGGDAWRLLSPRGVGANAWTVKNPPNTVERSLALLGRTADSGRVWDVLQAARSVEGSVGIIGRGQSGVIGAYAAVFDDKVDAVVLVEPPASHRQGPHFLGVLRVLDIPDALGLLAPRSVRVISGDAAAFAKTAEIFRAAGVSDQFKVERP